MTTTVTAFPSAPAAQTVQDLAVELLARHLNCGQDPTTGDLRFARTTIEAAQEALHRADAQLRQAATQRRRAVNGGAS